MRIKVASSGRVVPLTFVTFAFCRNSGRFAALTLVARRPMHLQIFSAWQEETASNFDGFDFIQH
jgi:hypothetical protein